MKIRARLLLALNRVLPRPITYPGDAVDDYSRWEYETGRDMFNRHFAANVETTNADWLDIGCGAGGKPSFYRTLEPRRVVAIDVLESNTVQSSSYAATAGMADPPLFAGADANALPFADRSFDIVTATDTFEHFPEPRRALEEMVRVLRPGGSILFYFTPHRSPLGSHLYDVIHLPWCHLLVPEGVLFEAIELSLARDMQSEGRGPFVDAARERAREIREYYHRDLNRMTVKRFLGIVGEVNGIQPVWIRRKPLKTRLLIPLTRIPPFDELTTTLVIGLLKRTS